MRICSVFGFGIVLLLSLPAVSARAHDRHAAEPNEARKMRLAAPIPVTMVGEVIDPQCYFTHGGQGKEHASCARKCALGGQDLAFFDEKTGRAYQLIALGHGDNPNDTVIALVGEHVEVRGTVYGMGQNVVLAVESAAIASGSTVVSGSSTTAARPAITAEPQSTNRKPEEIAIAVTTGGFVPATVTIPAGRPVVLVFTRRTKETCATEAVFKQIKKRVDLPLNRAVRVALGPQKAGRIDYACAMDMVRGSVVVR